MFGVSRGPWAIALLVASIGFAGCADEPKAAEKPPLDLPDKGAPWVPTVAPVLDAVEVLAHHADFVKTHPYRAWNSDTHLKAREFLAESFESAGLPVWRQEFETDIPQENICGVKLGVGEPDVWVVVGGHYDTTTWDDSFLLGGGAPGSLVSEGAYDDGSGTWITVELAKAYAKLESYYSILFCAFDGEEKGLQGSGAVFAAMQESDVFPYPINYTRAMLDFDMFGICWPVNSPIYVDHFDDKLLAEVQKIRKDLGVPDEMFKRWSEDSDLPPLGTSDYGHWSSADIPTIFLISDFGDLGAPTPVPTPVPLPSAPGVYPWWHWMDTVETMTLMAGGPDMLAAGFQTAVDIGSQTLAVMALHPELQLNRPPEVEA